MTQREFNRIIRAAEERKLAIMQSKGNEYCRSEEDRLANFKRIAATLNLSPIQVWYVYFQKHMDAIISYINTGKEGSEPIDGRIDDASVYLDLLRGFVAEHRIEKNAGRED